MTCAAVPYRKGPIPPEEIGPDNTVLTEDIGAFLQDIKDTQIVVPGRLNLGIRYDKNSIYGEAVSPRGTYIMKVNPSQFKTSFGRI